MFISLCSAPLTVATLTTVSVVALVAPYHNAEAADLLDQKLGQYLIRNTPVGKRIAELFISTALPKISESEYLAFIGEFRKSVYSSKKGELYDLIRELDEKFSVEFKKSFDEVQKEGVGSKQDRFIRDYFENSFAADANWLKELSALAKSQNPHLIKVNKVATVSEGVGSASGETGELADILGHKPTGANKPTATSGESPTGEGTAGETTESLSAEGTTGTVPGAVGAEPAADTYTSDGARKIKLKDPLKDKNLGDLNDIIDPDTLQLNPIKKMVIRQKGQIGVLRALVRSKFDVTTWVGVKGTTPYSEYDLNIIRSRVRQMDGVNSYGQFRLEVMAYVEAVKRNPVLYGQLNSDSSESLVKFSDGGMTPETLMYDRKRSLEGLIQADAQDEVTASLGLLANDEKVRNEALKKLIKKTELKTEKIWTYVENEMLGITGRLRGMGGVGGKHGEVINEVKAIKSLQGQVKALTSAADETKIQIIIDKGELKQLESPVTREEIKTKIYTKKTQLDLIDAKLANLTKEISIKAKDLEDSLIQFIDDYEKLELFINLPHGVLKNDLIGSPVLLPTAFLVSQQEVDSWYQLYRQGLSVSTNELVWRELKVAVSTYSFRNRIMINNLDKMSEAIFGKGKGFTTTETGKRYVGYAEGVVKYAAKKLGIAAVLGAESADYLLFQSHYTAKFLFWLGMGPAPSESTGDENTGDTTEPTTGGGGGGGGQQNQNNKPTRPAAGGDDSEEETPETGGTGTTPPNGGSGSGTVNWWEDEAPVTPSTHSNGGSVTPTHPTSGHPPGEKDPNPVLDPPEPEEN